MKNSLREAVWQALRYIKRAQATGRGDYHQALGGEKFSQAVIKPLERLKPQSLELRKKYDYWKEELQKLEKFSSVKMFLKRVIIDSLDCKEYHLDLVIVLLKLLDEQKLSLVFNAVIETGIMESYVIGTLSAVVDWEAQDEKQLQLEISWIERERERTRRHKRGYLLAAAGGAAVVIGACLLRKKKNIKNRGAS